MKIRDVDSFKRHLAALYEDASKHSSYQSIPEFVATALDYRVQIDENWRGDRVRLEYILSRLGGSDLRRWADFGANTGFFSLSLAHGSAAREVLAIEANPRHAAFLAAVAETFELANFRVIDRPLGIDDLESVPEQDVLLHLNVLHHAGADFDLGEVTGPDDFFAYAERYLSRLRPRTRLLVFQLGSNLWGDKSRPLVDPRDDAGRLRRFSSLLAAAGWSIRETALAARTPENTVEYRPLAVANALSLSPARLGRELEAFALDRHPGEFYRRPIFVCER